MNHVTNNQANEQTPPTQAPSAKPVKTFRMGPVGASVWLRSGNGREPYYEFSLSRSWKSTPTGKEGYSHNFSVRNANDLMDTIVQAIAWIHEQTADIGEDGGSPP